MEDDEISLILDGIISKYGKEALSKIKNYRPVRKVKKNKLYIRLAKMENTIFINNPDNWICNATMIHSDKLEKCLCAMCLKKEFKNVYLGSPVQVGSRTKRWLIENNYRGIYLLRSIRRIKNG